MKHKPEPDRKPQIIIPSLHTYNVQTPLPPPFSNPTNIRHFKGRGSGRQGPSPSASREEPAND